MSHWWKWQSHLWKHWQKRWVSQAPTLNHLLSASSVFFMLWFSQFCFAFENSTYLQRCAPGSEDKGQHDRRHVFTCGWVRVETMTTCNFRSAPGVVLKRPRVIYKPAWIHSPLHFMCWWKKVQRIRYLYVSPVGYHITNRGGRYELNHNGSQIWGKSFNRNWRF